MDEIVEQVQLAALYHASQNMLDATEVFERCSIDDFEPNQQQKVATELFALYARNQIEPMIVQEKVRAQSADLFKWYMTYVSPAFYGLPSYCGGRVREFANRRRLAATLTRAQSMLERNNEINDVTAVLHQDLASQEVSDTLAMPTLDLETMLATQDDERPWIVPSMLRTNERLIVTGPEGGGKSVLVAQMCLGAAMGVNTMSATLGRHEPMRVLMLDVENDKLQIRDNARKIYPTLAEMQPKVRPDIEWFDQTAIDLSDPISSQLLVRTVKEKQPDLLYMGSLYRLAPEGDKVDAAFTHVSRVVDRLRQEVGCSVMLEAHAGHGMMNDRNGMRPYGSSMWMRWPELGFGMVKHRESGAIQLKPWRGMRSDDRLWPAGMRRGPLLPWQMIDIAEWEERYGDE